MSRDPHNSERLEQFSLSFSYLELIFIRRSEWKPLLDLFSRPAGNYIIEMLEGARIFGRRLVFSLYVMNLSCHKLFPMFSDRTLR